MNPEQQPKLESWKEIATYLQRDVKTAHRWEKTEGLPVHRHTHKNRSSVYAYPAEIDAWRASRKVVPERVVIPLWKKPAFAAAMAMSLVMAGSLVRPQEAEAQGQTRTSICAGQGCDQRVMTPSGKLVLPPVPVKRGVVYSPDGSKIAYAQRSGPTTREAFAAEQISVANADGSNSRMVYRGAELFDWSADGKRLLVGVIPPDQAIHITNLLWLDLASGSTQKLPTVRPDLDVAMVSPDGKYIAFNASRDSGDPNVYIEQNLYIMASDGSGETIVSPSAGYQEPIGWTRDGKLIYGEWGAKLNVWTVEVSKGKVGTPFKTSAEFPKGTSVLGISRSGALYYRTTSNASDIFTATLDSAGKVNSGRIPVPVSTESVGVSVLPRWSPDSKQLAYMRIGPPREMQVFSFETGKEQRIAASARVTGSEHCWSRDGSSIFLNDKVKGAQFDLKTNQLSPMNTAESFPLATCNGDVVLARTGTGIEVRSGGTKKELYSMGTQGGTSTPVISHDGKNVAWVTPGVGASAPGSAMVLHVVSSGGGGTRDLVTEKAPAQLQLYWGLAWSADGRFVYYLRRADEASPFELMRVPVGGGDPEFAGLSGENIRDLDVAPDGRHIAFSVGAVNWPEVWELKGFLPRKK